jgi:hypothetical protein
MPAATSEWTFETANESEYPYAYSRLNKTLANHKVTKSTKMGSFEPL